MCFKSIPWGRNCFRSPGWDCVLRNQWTSEKYLARKYASAGVTPDLSPHGTPPANANPQSNPGSFSNSELANDWTHEKCSAGGLPPIARAGLSRSFIFGYRSAECHARRSGPYPTVHAESGSPYSRRFVSHGSSDIAYVLRPTLTE